MVRLQPMQKPLSRSIVQMPMQGEVTRLTIDDDDDGAAIDNQDFLLLSSASWLCSSSSLRLRSSITTSP